MPGKPFYRNHSETAGITHRRCVYLAFTFSVISTRNKVLRIFEDNLLRGLLRSLCITKFSRRAMIRRLVKPLCNLYIRVITWRLHDTSLRVNRHTIYNRIRGRLRHLSRLTNYTYLTRFSFIWRSRLLRTTRSTTWSITWLASRTQTFTIILRCHTFFSMYINRTRLWLFGRPSRQRVGKGWLFIVCFGLVAKLHDGLLKYGLWRARYIRHSLLERKVLKRRTVSWTDEIISIANDSAILHKINIASNDKCMRSKLT